MDDFPIVDLKPEDTALIQQTAQIAYETSQTISKIWLPDMDAALEEVYDSLNQDEGVSRVLLIDNTVAAWIGIFPLYSKIVEIHPLIVNPAYQNRGLGRRMVAQAIAWAERRGALTLFVGTSDETMATSLSLLGIGLYGNPGGAIANFHQLKSHPCGFWLKMGFRIVGVLPDAEGPGMPNIMLAKPL